MDHYNLATIPAYRLREKINKKRTGSEFYIWYLNK